MNLFRRAAKNPPTMTLEGVLGPNTLLEDAEGRPAPGACAIAIASDGALLVAQGYDLRRIADWQAEGEVMHRAPAPIRTLCTSPDGKIAIVCSGGALVVLAPNFDVVASWLDETGVAAATDAMFKSESELLILDGGGHPDDDSLARAAWDDTMQGSLVSLTSNGSRDVLVDGLHAPAGLCAGKGGLLITQMERACITDATGHILRLGLPGYLGRLRPAPRGYLLSCLARRDPLIEFLKTERAFVDEMKSTIAPAHWIAPRSDPGFSHDFPIEMGATRLFGEVKAWAPSFSYGLVIELDEQLRPIGSAHSRANGARHAIAEAMMWQGAMIAVCLGTGELLRMEVQE